MNKLFRRIFTFFFMILLASFISSCDYEININLKDDNTADNNEDKNNQDNSNNQDNTVSENTNNNNINKEPLPTGYSDTFNPIGNEFIDFNQWYLEYPSGIEGGGMNIEYNLNANICNKYFSKDGEWLKYSLDAQDKGKSTNGSNVRVELHNSHSEKYYFSGIKDGLEVSPNTATFKYTFKVNCTQLDISEYTVGQFEMYGNPARPLIMMIVQKGRLKAVIKRYSYSYQDGLFYKLGSTLNIDMGPVVNMEEMSIKIELNDRKIDIYRDNVKYVDESFLAEQDSYYGVFFKLGIYYQTKADDPNIDFLFTDVYVKDISLNIQ